METELGRIPSHWEVGSFEEDLKIQGRIGWKGYKTSDLVPIGPYVIGGGEIKSNIFLQLEHAQRISREKYNESPEIMLKEGDVLLVTRGNLGEVGYYHGIYGEGTINPSVIILNNFNGDSKFLFYYLISKQGKANVLSLSSGSSVPAIYQADVYTLKYPKPLIDEQTKISKIAFSIDLKIDLLHRQNATLEKMAETLFRQWFVEEAKEEWKNGKVSDLIKILSGYAFKSSSFVESGKYRLITIKGVQDGYLELNNADKIEEVPDRMPDFCKLEIGDIILSLTGNVGRCCLVDTTDLLLNQRVAKLHPIYERDRAYTYFLFRQPQIKQLLEEMGKGTAQPNLSPIETSNMELIIPDEEKLIEFSVMATPLLNKMLFNKKSIQTLTALRDTLLPKLMSGEVRVVQD